MTNHNLSSIDTLDDLMQLPAFPERRHQGDPFVNLLNRHGNENVAPMVKLDFQVTIRGGLVFVKSIRTYINRTDGPIEAIMSIPVSVQATFFGLSAEIDGVQYNAKAKPKDKALDIYEGAIDEGKVTVLHQELMRGIHSLSVGNLGAHKTVIVTTRSVELLRIYDGHGQIKIPLTVGDVYGLSALEDVDSLTSGGSIPEATIQIEYDASNITLLGGSLEHQEGNFYAASVPGNAPIELKVSEVAVSELIGVTPDGRQVIVEISPHEKQCEALNAAILVDRSGSMACRIMFDSDNQENQHQAAVRGLYELSPLLMDNDQLALWEFDTECDRVGEINPKKSNSFRQLVSNLSKPRGGTSIGSAIQKVFAVEEGKDVLVITDGQSYQLDVEQLVRAGQRVFVVLVGEGSLEALIGHLAVLSGGDIHFSFGSDVGQAIQACIQGMRQENIENQEFEVNGSGNPERVVIARNNATIEATWSDSTETLDAQGEFSEAIAAFAASLVFAGVTEETAIKIAVDAGLVTHLTSLILVAEDGPIQEELPKTIKQSVPDSRTMGLADSGNVVYSSTGQYSVQPEARSYAPPRDAIFSSPDILAHRRYNALSYDLHDSIDWYALKQLAQRIDWNSGGSKLVHGDFDETSSEIMNEILMFAYELEEVAMQLGMHSHILVIAMAAFSVRESSKWAARVYRKIMRDHDRVEFDKFAQQISFSDRH